MRMSMRRLAMVVMVAAMLAAGVVRAANVPVCCACTADRAHEGVARPPQPPATQAIFCATTDDGPGQAAAAQQCADLSGGLECVYPKMDQSCDAALLDAGFLCSTAARAPLLSPALLGGLALALGGLGIGLARRRRG